LVKLILHTFDKAKYPQLLLYCQEASKKDSTFKYQVQPDRIIIENPSKQIAFKRGVRLHSLFKCYFEVVWEQNERKV
jgi:hypothetical protein